MVMDTSSPNVSIQEEVSFSLDGRSGVNLVHTYVEQIREEIKYQRKIKLRKRNLPKGG